jgi:hypothetical protein
MIVADGGDATLLTTRVELETAATVDGPSESHESRHKAKLKEVFA